MAASGSAAARSHSATPSAFACGMASSRTSKRATQRIPTLALGLSTLRLPSLVQYFSMGCEAIHNRQSPQAADLPPRRTPLSGESLDCGNYTKHACQKKRPGILEPTIAVTAAPDPKVGPWRGFLGLLLARPISTKLP